MNQEVSIIPFQGKHQNDISTMMKGISLEFEESIFSSQSKKIIDLYELPNHKFWVAQEHLKVIGTIGLITLSNNNIALKSMFVNKTFRGKKISNLLLNTVIKWAIEHNYKRIYLGTMQQFKAGQKFYENNGFIKCTQSTLPNDFIMNKLDTIFYTKNLD